MGFPVCYSELLLPKLLLDTLSVLAALRRLISALLRLASLPSFLDQEARDHPALSPVAAAPEPSLSVSAVMMRQILPVVKFSDLVDPPESCAICLYDFNKADETRRLTNCSHVLHRGCLDHWIAQRRRRRKEGGGLKKEETKTMMMAMVGKSRNVQLLRGKR